MQAPGKGTAYYGGQVHTMGYNGGYGGGGYNCVGCQPTYQQPVYTSGGCGGCGHHHRRGWRRRGC
jgi:hypothetical protein